MGFNNNISYCGGYIATTPQKRMEDFYMKYNVYEISFQRSNYISAVTVMVDSNMPMKKVYRRAWVTWSEKGTEPIIKIKKKHASGNKLSSFNYVSARII